MNWSDYEVDGQLSIFDYIQPRSTKIKFEPIEEFAKITHIADRHNRIANYFSEHEDLKDRVIFLKKEYSYGGGYMAKKDTAYKIISYDSDNNRHSVEWNMLENGNLHRVTTQFSYETLAKTIDLMIKQNRYLQRNLETR